MGALTRPGVRVQYHSQGLMRAVFKGTYGSVCGAANAVPVRAVETGRMDTKTVGHCVCLVPRCTLRVAQYMSQAVC